VKGFPTTYLGMFDGPDDERDPISAIEIPIIQRDYAQGRDDDVAGPIRVDFVDVLVRAATNDEKAGLDFVYGEVKNGTFVPLDGQQRLTSLFLFHWYVASRAGTLDPEASWTSFAYATRASAELFCRELIKSALPDTADQPAEWIRDQPWYLFPWRRDPTIRSMLVMLDAIADRFAREPTDFRVAWSRLADRSNRAIAFLVLPVSEMRSGEELYIKMNSRGRPLTSFEVFKARLEKALQSSGRDKKLAEKFDRDWSDMLWQYEGGDFAIDDEFMRYLEFIMDVCEWRDKRIPDSSDPTTSRLTERASQAFTPPNQHGIRNLDFFFHAFDTWVGTEPADEFAKLFSTETETGPGLRLFESRESDLFGACLTNYGTTRFTYADRLLLFAVLIYRQRHLDCDAGELESRLRPLRNLAESSPNEVRAEYMPELVDGTERLIVDGSLENLARFNQARVEDERLKRSVLARYPEVTSSFDELEDHDLLRGRLVAFELDPTTFADRAATFRAIAEPSMRSAMSAALLTKGDYSRNRKNDNRSRQFGSTTSPVAWRDVLTSGSRDSAAATRSALAALLDDVGARGGAADALQAIRDDWLTKRDAEQHFDWRYYFVRYDSMRASPTGIYFGEHLPATGDFGYSICMLRRTQMGSYCWDPFLLAIWDEAALADFVEQPFLYLQSEYEPRWMTFKRSATRIRCTDTGFEIVGPAKDSPLRLNFEEVAAELEIDNSDDSHLLRVSQTQVGDSAVDTVDRIQVGIDLAKRLVKAGL
jgi:Protein of unknown function DUF262